MITRDKSMAKKRFATILTNRRFQEWLVLAFIFVISLAIRMIGIKHGFPLLTHPDEGVILHPVFNMTRYQTLNPGFFGRPNQIMYYINFLYLNSVSFLKFGRSLAETFHANQVIFHFYARLLVSIMGSLIPVVAYKIGKEFEEDFALPAGLVFALFPLYTEHALYVTPDIPITLFTLCVMYFTLRDLNQKDGYAIYLAILFSAINTAEKYPGLISMAIIFGGVLIKLINESEFSIKKYGWLFVKKCLILLLLFVVALFIVAPFLFIEYQLVIEALITESRSTHLGADNLGWAGNLLFYVRTFISWSNWLAIFMIGFGIYALVKWRKTNTIILLYGVLYWILLSKLSLHWERWALPMYITPLFLVAIGITYFWNLIKNSSRSRLLAVLILLLLSQQLLVSLYTTVRATFTDTRLVALDFCQENGITQENAIFDGYTPFLPHGSKFLDAEEIDKNDGKSYIILSSYMYDRFYKEPERYENQVALYEDIRNTHVLIEKVKPTPRAANTIERIGDVLFYAKRLVLLSNQERYTGPTIEIYRISN